MQMITYAGRRMLGLSLSAFLFVLIVAGSVQSLKRWNGRESPALDDESEGEDEDREQFVEQIDELPPEPGTDVVFLIDISGSMDPYLEDAVNAVSTWTQECFRDNRYTLASFPDPSAALARRHAPQSGPLTAEFTRHFLDDARARIFALPGMPGDERTYELLAAAAARSNPFEFAWRGGGRRQTVIIVTDDDGYFGHPFPLRSGIDRPYANECSDIGCRPSCQRDVVLINVDKRLPNGHDITFYDYVDMLRQGVPKGVCE